MSSKLNQVKKLHAISILVGEETKKPGIISFHTNMFGINTVHLTQPYFLSLFSDVEYETVKPYSDDSKHVEYRYEFGGTIFFCLVEEEQ